MSERIARRRPWLAVLLQLIVPGLGDLYCGRPTRGLVAILLVRCVAFVSVLALLWLPYLLNVGAYVLCALFVYVFLIVDGFLCARSANPDYRLAWYNRWYVYVLVAVLVSFMIPDIILFQRHIAAAFRQPIPSNEPTLWVGDRVMADRTAYWYTEPRRGEFVVFRLPDDLQKSLISRIIGLPGETIEIRSRVVFINGKELEEPYVRFQQSEQDPTFPGTSFAPYAIPENAYFVLGDNRDNSLDSRYIGVIQREHLQGKLKMVYFSWDSENLTVRWNQIGKVLESQ